VVSTELTAKDVGD